MDAPSDRFDFNGEFSTRSSTRRTTRAAFQMRTDPTDGGIALYDPHSAWTGLSLPDLTRFAGWLLEWARFRREQFKPLGFNLVSLLDGSVVPIKDGATVKIVGDSFVLFDVAGTQVGEARSAAEWLLQPILPTGGTAVEA